MTEPDRRNALRYEVEASYASTGPSGMQSQTSKFVWVARPPSGSGHATPADENPPGRDEEVKPDLLLDPPEPKPDQPHDPPDSADR